MNDDLDELAALHALDLLKGEERTRFEKQLRPSARLQRLVDANRAAAASFGREAAPRVTPPASALGALRQRIATEPPSSRHPRQSAAWGRWGWPAAALFLFGSNVFLLWQSGKESPGPMVSALPPVDPAQAEIPAADPETAALRERVRDLEEALRTSEDVARSRAAEGQTLQAALTDAEMDQATTARALAALRQRIAPLLEGHPGYARYTVIDLVDPEAFLSGERTGLAEIAGAFLQAPGIALLERSGAPPTAPQGAPDAPALSGLNAHLSGFASNINFLESNIFRPPSPALEELLADAGATFAGRTHAFTVFDESSGHGFMDLYNLPQATAEGGFHLWVRSALDEAAYEAVGVLPTGLQGNSGSIFFEIPSGPTTPVEFIITEEVTDAPAAPGGPIILRGP